MVMGRYESGSQPLTRSDHLRIGGASPHRTGVVYSHISVSVSTTVQGEYRVIGVDNTSAARTITLGRGLIKRGRFIDIKDESGGAAANNITVATEGSETIDGAATATISTNYGVVRLYSDGTNWFTR